LLIRKCAWARSRRLAGRLFYVLHDLNTLQVDPVAQGIDVIVSGHSHVPKINTVDGLLYLNPGSAGHRRFKLPITLASLEVTPAGLKPIIRDLEVGALRHALLGETFGAVSAAACKPRPWAASDGQIELRFDIVVPQRLQRRQRHAPKGAPTSGRASRSAAGRSPSFPSRPGSIRNSGPAPRDDLEIEELDLERHGPSPVVRVRRQSGKNMLAEFFSVRP
jgi:hypothetical protein